MNRIYRASGCSSSLLSSASSCSTLGRAASSSLGRVSARSRSAYSTVSLRLLLQRWGRRWGGVAGYPLARVLGFELGHLEVDYHVAAQLEVIKQQVEVVVLAIYF